VLVTGANGDRSIGTVSISIRCLVLPNQQRERLTEVSVLSNARGAEAGPHVISDSDNAILARVKMPAGYYYNWSGHVKRVRAKKRYSLVVPIAIGIISLLLYLTLPLFLVSGARLLAVTVCSYRRSLLLWLLPYNSRRRLGRVPALFGTRCRRQSFGDLPRRSSVESKTQDGVLTRASARRGHGLGRSSVSVQSL